MKRDKAGRRVLMGQIDAGTYNGIENRIQLFDGKFTTGYRIVDFKITPQLPGSAYELIGKVSTEPKSTIGYFNWNDVQEVAWATWNAPTNSRYGAFSLVRDGNMIIEDLWISFYTTGEAIECNYEIILEKYSFAAWDGAGILVENLSQAGPQ